MALLPLDRVTTLQITSPLCDKIYSYFSFLITILPDLCHNIRVIYDKMKLIAQNEEGLIVNIYICPVFSLLNVLESRDC